MTKAEYSNYEQAVAEFLKENDVKPGCFGPHYKDTGNADETFFSGRPCHCCVSPVGGNRERYTFAKNEGGTFVADICTDCVYYLAHDRLDDATMMELQNS